MNGSLFLNVAVQRIKKLIFLMFATKNKNDKCLDLVMQGNEKSLQYIPAFTGHLPTMSSSIAQFLKIKSQGPFQYGSLEFHV
uniref:Uncharacterized protein n=1 Tax=Rhizophora mucronata TaxID=61149 RepID=A0A2P2NQC9_RHIMU